MLAHLKNNIDNNYSKYKFYKNLYKTKKQVNISTSLNN